MNQPNLKNHLNPKFLKYLKFHLNLKFLKFHLSQMFLKNHFNR